MSVFSPPIITPCDGLQPLTHQGATRGKKTKADHRSALGQSTQLHGPRRQWPLAYPVEMRTKRRDKRLGTLSAEATLEVCKDVD